MDREAILELMAAVDDYIPTADARPGQDVPDAGRGRVLDHRPWHGGDRSYRAWYGEGRRGDRDRGYPRHAKTVVTGVEMFRKLLDQGEAGDNVGVLLRGTKREDVERGQVLCEAGFDHAAHEVLGQGVRPDEGRRRASHAVLQRLPPAVLLPDDRRDGQLGETAGERGDGDAGRQRVSCRSSSSRRSRWNRVCASRSAKVAAPSVPASLPPSKSSPRQRKR